MRRKAAQNNAGARIFPPGPKRDNRGRNESKKQNTAIITNASNGLERGARGPTTAKIT